VDGEAIGEAVQRRDGGPGQGLAAPLPQDGPQLVVLGERDPVVAAVQVAVGDGQQVADLAVGIVDHRVEGGHLA
jgi:hypothetical protein